MNHPLLWACLCYILVVCVGACLGANTQDVDHSPPSPPPQAASTHLTTSADQSALEEHHLSKRFIWTLTQEPYFYGKYGRVGADGGRGEDVGSGSELLPQSLALRNPTSMHKRLYPRWYQAYVYKNPTFGPAPSVGERKRFQPFHPMARFRGMGLGGGSHYPSYHNTPSLPMSQPSHPVPSAPNVQPSSKFEVEDEEDDVEEDDEANPLKAGELLQLLRTLATDRGLPGHTKAFRFGLSRK